MENTESDKRDFSLPYFDLLLETQKNCSMMHEECFDFVHWGFWDASEEYEPGLAGFKRGQGVMNAKLMELADISNGMKIADVGCGFGGTIGEMNRVYRQVDLTGINIDPRQLEVARERVKPFPGNKVNWLEADATRIPLPDNSFDRILAVECIFHFPSRQKFLNEAARLLKPGGRLVLSDFCGYRQVKKNMAAKYPAMMGRKGFITKMIVGWFERSYGELGPPPGSEPPYAEMISGLPMELSVIRDVTKNTLFTYRHIYYLIARYRTRTNKKLPDLVKATRFLDWTARLGLIRYVLLCFGKYSTKKN